MLPELVSQRVVPSGHQAQSVTGWPGHCPPQGVPRPAGIAVRRRRGVEEEDERLEQEQGSFQGSAPVGNGPLGPRHRSPIRVGPKPKGTNPAQAPGSPTEHRPQPCLLSSNLPGSLCDYPWVSGLPPPGETPPTLLFWMRRIRCSKQLLLRKVACSTGRSSHASIMGIASV